jgi:flavodoxin I
MKVLVGYFSETGNTKKVAEAIAKASKALEHGTDLKAVGEIEPAGLANYDVVFLGSTVHSADVAAPVRSLLDGIPDGSTFKLVGFATHATLTPSKEAWHTDMYEKWASKAPKTFRSICEAKGVELLGYFHCQGAPSAPIEQFIKSTIVTDEAQWATYIDAVRQHPTAEDLEAARSFAQDMLAEA